VGFSRVISGRATPDAKPAVADRQAALVAAVRRLTPDA
jgi:hypothetical protein